MTKLTRVKYHPLRVWLHWISAAVILWALFSGFYAAYATTSSELKAIIGYINVSLTTLFVPVFTLRIICAFLLASPDDMPASGKVQQQLAKGMHFIIYLVTSVVMVTGILMMERDIPVFEWFTLPRPIKNDVITFRFKLIHISSCVLLSFILCGHIFAVLSHMMKGNKIMSRMSL